MCASVPVSSGGDSNALPKPVRNAIGEYVRQCIASTIHVIDIRTMLETLDTMHEACATVMRQHAESLANSVENACDDLHVTPNEVARTAQGALEPIVFLAIEDAVNRTVAELKQIDEGDSDSDVPEEAASGDTDLRATFLATPSHFQEIASHSSELWCRLVTHAIEELGRQHSLHTLDLEGKFFLPTCNQATFSIPYSEFCHIRVGSSEVRNDGNTFEWIDERRRAASELARSSFDKHESAAGYSPDCAMDALIARSIGRFLTETREHVCPPVRVAVQVSCVGSPGFAKQVAARAKSVATCCFHVVKGLQSPTETRLLESLRSSQVSLSVPTRASIEAFLQIEAEESKAVLQWYIETLRRLLDCGLRIPDKKDPFGRVVYRAIELLRIATDPQAEPETQLIFAMASIEAILSGTKDQIAESVARRMSGLLVSDSNDRYPALRAFKQLYDRRSTVVHGTATATRADCSLAISAAGLVILAVLERNDFQHRIGFDRSSPEHLREILDIAYSKGERLDGVPYEHVAPHVRLLIERMTATQKGQR